jgi:serine/threonine protein kinase
MIDALNLVYKSPEARPFAEYPLSIRTPDEASQQCYQLIYRDLTKFDFRIGAPNRMTPESSYDLYVAALTNAINCIHRAGVIHVDLYLSNVMWRMLNGEVEIKIIDWDASHCLNEGAFVGYVEDALNAYLGSRNVSFGPQHDLLYIAVLSLEKEKYKEHWERLASTDKEVIDDAFRYLLQEVLDDTHSKR